MVRLKDSKKNESSKILELFQFLMVRLKENQEQDAVSRKKISIPYGAIKSLLSKSFEINKIQFQFLMVRLKEKIEKNILTLSAKFQFLMVRLKETRMGVVSATKDTFQFLMVRLKAVVVFLVVVFLADFNSLWCD